MAMGKNSALSKQDDLIKPSIPVKDSKEVSGKVVSGKDVKVLKGKEVSNKQVSGKELRTKAIKKETDKGTIQISIWLTKEIVKDLKLSAVENNTYISEIVEKALKKYLQK